MVESIIDSVKEYKSLCEFNATDFNADKVKLYEKVRQMMAGKFASENYFGPVEKTVAEKPVKEMSKEEHKAYRAVHDKAAEMIRKGYNRIKEKVNGQLLARAKGSTFFSYKRSVKLTRLGG